MELTQLRKRSRKLQKDLENNTNFQKIKKNRDNINENINTLVVVFLNDDRIFTACIDDYEERSIAFYDVQILHEDDKWYTQNEWFTEHEGKVFPDFMPMFPTSEIKAIYSYKDDIPSEILQQLLCDPSHNIDASYSKGHIECDWNHDDNHSPECSKDIHEALSYIITLANGGNYGKCDQGLEEVEKRNLKRKELNDQYLILCKALLNAGYEIAKCNWDYDDDHSPECSKDVHEALSYVTTLAVSGMMKNFGIMNDKHDQGLENLGKRNIKQKELDNNLLTLFKALWNAGYKIP